MESLGGIRLRKPALLSINNTAPAPAGEETVMSEAKKAAAEEEEVLELEEPVSPAERLFREPHFSCYILCTFGVAKPVDLPSLRAGVEATLARHPRFCSIQVLDEQDKGAKPKWVRTKVNLDDHIVVVPTDTSAVADPDKVVEDYVSSLSTPSMPMDHSRRLGAPRTPLPHRRGRRHRRAPRASLPRRRRLAPLPPHRLHPPRHRPGRAPGAPDVLRPTTRPGVRAGATAAARLGARGARVGRVVARARVAHGGGRGAIRADGGVGRGRRADGAQGRGGRRVPAKAVREPHAQPRPRQERHGMHCE